MNKKLNIYRILTLVLVIIILIFLVLFCRNYNTPAPELIIIHDSICITKFETKIKEIPVYFYDTIVSTPVIVNDTVYKEIKDTIHIPIEAKESSFNIKKDSFEINGNIHYHGFKADIDKVDVDYKFTYQPPVEHKRKFHISVQAGFGAQYGLINRKFDIGPYVGIGGSYDLW